MSEVTEDELFAMVNLVPRLTGLPMTIWVRPESGLPHDIRIKVNMTHGRSMSISNLAWLAWPRPLGSSLASCRRRICRPSAIGSG